MYSTGIKIASEEKGLQLRGSILWFDAPKSSQISFTSSALSFPNIQSSQTQFVQSVGTSRIIEAMGKKQKSLVCQYNRPFSIGSIKMELLPTGSILGAASIFLEADGEKLLYAPFAQPQKQTLVRKMQLKKTDNLLLDANIKNLKLSLPSRKKEKDRILNRIFDYRQKNGFYPILTASAIGTAQELTQLCSANNIPVAVHNQIAKINKIYNEFGIDLGKYKSYSKRSAKEKLVILPFSFNYTRPFKLPSDQDIFAVGHDSRSYEALNKFDGLYEVFLLNTRADGPELKEIIAGVQPKKILVTGEHIQHYMQQLKMFSSRLQPIYKNDQPSFF